MSKSVLGLDINDYNTSAALVVDGQLVTAAQEERFNREKRTRRFPWGAAQFCLRRAGIALADLDAAAVSVNPAIYLEALNPAQSERARYRGELLYAPVNFLLGQMPGAAVDAAQLRLRGAPFGELVIHYVTHHDCHAATAFYLSPFDTAAILSIDGFGEKESTVLYRGEGPAIRRLQSVEFPHSLGSFYAAMTEFLGLRPNRHEWKLMAAAAHGDPEVFRAAMGSLVRHTGKGRFEVDLSCFNYHQFHRSGFFAPKLTDLLGPSYRADSEPDQRFFDIAAATQAVLEDVVFALLRDLAEMAPSPNLCVTGGVALNCVLNGKIAAHTPFQQVFVPPMPDDSGTSIGAALRVAVENYGAGRPRPLVRNDLGPAFSDAEIEAELRRANIGWERPADVAQSAAQQIATGSLVGWFQGGMEFGDRALGWRSILADPRDPAIPARITAAVKDRPAYQPFAPSVLADRAGEWFLNAAPSPFMEKVFLARPEKAPGIPAVLGPNGSARVQTTTREQNEPFCRLLGEFEKLTGAPLVLNTSFNLRGEPIVCTPRDALRTFFSSGLDALFIGPFLVDKRAGRR